MSASARVVVSARTGAGNLQEHLLPAGVSLSDVESARRVVERDHAGLGHHLNADGTERADRGFAGFVRECVPQSEARALLERAADAPEPVVSAVRRGGVDAMILLYALTLPRARSRTRPGGGVWIGLEPSAYEPRRLTGRCSNGAERDGGVVYHAVAGWKAACGAEPGRRSAGWSQHGGEAVTCPKCLAATGGKT